MFEIVKKVAPKDQLNLQNLKKLNQDAYLKTLLAIQGVISVFVKNGSSFFVCILLMHLCIDFGYQGWIIFGILVILGRFH